MKNYRRYERLSGLLAGALVWSMSLAGSAVAQSGRTIDAGTTISVRTTEEISTNSSDGRVYGGVVDQDVMNRAGTIAIPRGADVEMLVRSLPDKEIALDLDSVMVGGQRYGIQAADTAIASEQRDGIGTNKRTGVFVGGGAAIGAIIGAITGGTKGAAIGGGIGAAAGAGTQVLTRGKSVNVPVESLVTFRLDQPLQTLSQDGGFSRNGQHYHPGFATTATDTPAYKDGLRTGSSDSDRSAARNIRSRRWTSGQQLRDYQEGYAAGYDRSSGNIPRVSGSVRIGSDKNISWTGPPDSRLYVQVDNNPIQLFASGTGGSQMAPWISQGHLYVFVLRDPSGREIARDTSDLRQRRQP